MKNRKGFAVIFVGVVATLIFATLFYLTVSNLNEMQQNIHVASDLLVVPKLAQQTHQNLNVYIQLEPFNGGWIPSAVYFEKKNKPDGTHYLPSDNYDKNVMGCISGHLSIDKIDPSEAYQINQDGKEYIVLCVKPDRKIYTVTSMHNGVDVSVKPLTDPISLQVESGTGRNILIKITSQNMYEKIVHTDD